MTRFFKSAAFPILIVIVLAFFVQKLIGSTSHPLSASRYGTGRSGASPYCARTWFAAAITDPRVNADAVPANASAATAATTPTLNTV